MRHCSSPERTASRNLWRFTIDPKGNFSRDGRYIFAYDYEGRTLALPYQPKLVGTNRIDAQDPNGVKFVQQAADMASMGNGILYYIYPDSSRNMTRALKLSYVSNVEWYLVPRLRDLRRGRGADRLIGSLID
jgi:signal transduction histidine kinase